MISTLGSAAVGLLLVLTQMAFFGGPATAATSCTIKGTAGPDVLVGTAKNDTICGLGGADELIGRGGSDKLVGGGGNDILRGAGGQDQLFGGGGADQLLGGSGADRLSGGTGADRLDGNGAADTMTGGGGSDTVTYASRTGAVTVRLDGTARSGVAGEQDTVATDVEHALGGAGDDLLLGSASANQLSGGPGRDTLEGRGGSDTLTGDDGLVAASQSVTHSGRVARLSATELTETVPDDTMSGGDGDDTLIGGSGDDVLDGGGGTDTVSYADASSPVIADLDGLSGDGTAGEADTIGVDVENLTGGADADILTGSDAANVLDGGAGADELYGAGGADLVDAGSGAGDLTDGGSGSDQCVASDQVIEDVPNCEPLNGFGVYNRVSLDPPPAADEQGVVNGSKVPLAAAALSTGETVVLVRGASGDPSITKLDELGGIDTSFGTDGWVYGLPALLGLDRGYPTTLQVLDDEIYVGFLYQDTYLAKLDSSGELQTDFGGDGFISLRDALGEAACPVACGDYGFNVSAAGISVGWNDFHPENSPQWSAGTLRFSVADGTVVQATTFEDGLVDGGLPSDILAVPGGASVSITRAGSIRRYLADGTRDVTFAGDGVLESDAELVGDGRTVPRPQLVISEDGFARVGLAGTPKPADNTGVPKLVETEPQWALFEQFALDGTPTPAYGDSWTETSVELPAEAADCDTTAAGTQSISTSAMDPLVSGSLVPIRRCSDAIWVALDPAGGGTVVRRPGPNQPRDTDSVSVPGGTLLVYASARDIVSLELVEGELVDLAVVPRKPSLTVSEGLSASQGVRLTSEPSGPVTVEVMSEDTSVASVSPSTMTFTPDNWSTPQQVTVTVPADVDLVDGATVVQLVSDQARSSWFSITVDDTDVQSIVTDSSGLVVSEGGSSALAVSLGRKPSSNVTVGVASSDTARATVSLTSLDFTPDNWDVPQTLDVAGVHDVDTTAESVTVTLTSPGVASTSVSVGVLDDDVQALLASPDGLILSEAGSQTIEVTLAFQPQSDVSVAVESGDPDAATVDHANLVFTPTNWSVPQVVTVSGVDDIDAEDEHLDVLLTSLDAGGESVTVRVVDDDTPGLG